MSWRSSELFNLQPDFLLVTDLRGRIVDINTFGCARLGLAYDVITTLLLRDIVADPHAIVAGWLQRIRTDGEGVFECTTMAAGGAKSPIEFSATKLEDGHILFVGRPMAARRHIEDVLQSRTDHLRDIVENLPFVLIVTTVKGEVSRLNRQARNLVPLEHPTPLGNPIENGPWWTGGQKSLTQVRRMVEAAASGRSHRYDEDFRTPDGSIHRFDVSFTPILDDLREVSHIVVSALDVTALEKLESGQKLEGLIEGRSGGLGQLNTSGIWLSADETLQDLLGLETRELVGQMAWKTLGKSNQSPLQEHLDRLLEGESTVMSIEFANSEGQALRATIGRSQQGDDIAADVAVVPLTPIDHQASAEAEQEQTQQMRASLLANVSHELRTPMNAILGLTRVMLEEEGVPTEVNRSLKVTFGAAQQLMRLLNDLLDFSESNSGKLELVESTFSPARVVANVVAIHRPMAIERGLSLELKDETGGGDFFSGDEDRYSQVVTNLISNALKYTEVGSITVRLATSSSDEPEHCAVHLSVADTGVGISQTVRRNIFRPFERGREVRRLPGLGLGLSIVKDLIDAMGGEISIETRRGVGSTFRITVPLRRSRPDLEAIVDATVPRPEEIPPTRRLNVLVIDDTKANRYLVQSVLSRRGHLIDESSDGYTGVERRTLKPYDAILMDVTMPGIDGLEATRRIRQWENRNRAEATPIIAMTAHVMPGDREECLAAGMNGYISKPIDIRELCTVVEEAGSRIGAVKPAVQEVQNEVLTPEGIAKARARLGGDESLFLTMVTLFREEAPRILGQIQDQAPKPSELTRRAAHTLKSQAATIGAEQASRIARNLEQAIEADQAAEVVTLTEELTLSIAATLKALRKANFG